MFTFAMSNEIKNPSNERLVWIEIMATLLKVTGEKVNIEPKNADNGFTLQECYNHIGCDLIEVVDLLDGNILICDEEGALISNPEQNLVASTLATTAYNYQMTIFGNVILCKSEELK